MFFEVEFINQLFFHFQGPESLKKKFEHVRKFKSAITDTLLELCVAKEDDTNIESNLEDEQNDSGVKDGKPKAPVAKQEKNKFEAVKIAPEKLEKIVGYEDTVQELRTLMICHKQPQLFNENQRHQLHNSTALMHGLPVRPSFIFIVYYQAIKH